MDTLEVLVVAALVWFGKKLKNIAGALVSFAWWFVVLACPVQRCMMAHAFHTAFLKTAITLHQAGVLRGSAWRKTGQFHEWARPRLDAWRQRGLPA